MTWREALLWCAAACVPVLVSLERTGGPIVSNDSYQYLSAAENLVAGKGLSTSILHFDIDRAPGVIPAPLTMFPPGYPMAIAAFHMLGVPLEAAAAAVSGLAFIALVPILLGAARSLGLTRVATRLGLVWLISNSWSFLYPAFAVTESLFTALSTTALMLFLADESQDRRRPARLIAASVLIGLSYWVRYAGILLLAGTLVYYGSRLLFSRDRSGIKLLLYASVPAALIIGANAFRNILLTGSWKAGYEQQAPHNFMILLYEFAAAVHHLFLGTNYQLGAADGLLALSALSLVALGHWALRRNHAALVPREWGTAILLATFVATYAAGMLAIARVSMISFGPRMFYPLLPLALLGLAAMSSHIELACARSVSKRVVLFGGLVLGTVAYSMINARTIAEARPLALHHKVAERLAGPTAAGDSLRTWINQHIPPGATLVASDGQATAYALRHPTVSLTQSHFTSEAWTEDRVRTLMASYGAEFLILYPRSDPVQNPVQTESAFLWALLQGAMPPWLTLAAENDDVRIFQRRPMAGF